MVKNNCYFTSLLLLGKYKTNNFFFNNRKAKWISQWKDYFPIISACPLTLGVTFPLILSGDYGRRKKKNLSLNKVLYLMAIFEKGAWVRHVCFLSQCWFFFFYCFPPEFTHNYYFKYNSWGYWEPILEGVFLFLSSHWKEQNPKICQITSHGRSICEKRRSGSNWASNFPTYPYIEIHTPSLDTQLMLTATKASFCGISWSVLKIYNSFVCSFERRFKIVLSSWHSGVLSSWSDMVWGTPWSSSFSLGGVLSMFRIKGSSDHNSFKLYVLPRVFTSISIIK